MVFTVLETKKKGGIALAEIKFLRAALYGCEVRESVLWLV